MATITHTRTMRDEPREPRIQTPTYTCGTGYAPRVRHLGTGSSDRKSKDNPIDLLHSCLPQPARLALPLQQHEDVALADRTLHVPHDRARGVVEELNAHLDHRAGLASAAEDLGHLRELDGLILRRRGGKGPSANTVGLASRAVAVAQGYNRAVWALAWLHTDCARRRTSTCADCGLCLGPELPPAARCTALRRAQCRLVLCSDHHGTDQSGYHAESHGAVTLHYLPSEAPSCWRRRQLQCGFVPLASGLLLRCGGLQR